MSTEHKILIAEDDLPSAELLREILEQVRYQVLVADDGADAVELAKKEHPDLVILDVMLPSLNGFEVCDRIRSEPALATVPIIMLTVLNEPQHRIRSIKAGATDFLTKPFDRLELLTKVRSFLGIQDEITQRIRCQDAARCLFTALSNRSPEAGTHAKRVARLSEQLGRLLGLDPVEVRDLTMGALLHDAGKLALNGTVVVDPDGLSAEDRSTWQRHTQLGDVMLSQFNRPAVSAIARSHHEHLDGSGFPDGLSGDQLATGVRIVGLCNRFDHLIGGSLDNHDVVKKALTALREEVATGLWDPHAFEELEQLFKLYTHVMD